MVEAARVGEEATTKAYREAGWHKLLMCPAIDVCKHFVELGLALRWHMQWVHQPLVMSPCVAGI